MQTLITITGCLVWIAISLSAMALAAWGFVAMFRWIDWQIAVIIFRRSQVAHVMIEVTDNLARKIIHQHGSQPFDEGSRVCRKKYEEYHAYAKVDLPGGYITIAEEAAKKEAGR